MTSASRGTRLRRGAVLTAALSLWLLAMVGARLGAQDSRSTPDGHSHHAPAQARLVVNPLAVSPSDLARGRELYEQECSSCHGDDGKAQTARAGRLQKRPTDLTNSELARHADGELFWVVTHGIPASKMPGFHEDFSDDDRWRIVAYARSLRRSAVGAPVPSAETAGASAAAPAPAYAWNLPPGFPQPKVPADNPMTAEKVELGRHLFYDTRLSVNGTFSCASCHEQKLAFTDGKARGVGATGEVHPRGSMSLANIAYAPVLTWANPTMRKLEQQMLVPMFGEDPVELGMAGREAAMLETLRADQRYQELFTKAFAEDSAGVRITLANLAKAVASFQRTLISGRSPYDRYRFSGDATAISASAKRGEALFFDERTECFHCHGSFNFTETVDHVGKGFAEIEFHNTGLYNLDGKGSYPKENPGVFAITGNEDDMGRFKAPTLRNVAVTAPYMHDGSVRTLDEVLDHYAAGGRTVYAGPLAGKGSDSPLKSAFVKPIDLTPQERADLKAFLESLTDTAFLTDPRFANPWTKAARPVRARH